MGLQAEGLLKWKDPQGTGVNLALPRPLICDCQTEANAVHSMAGSGPQWKGAGLWWAQGLCAAVCCP